MTGQSLTAIIQNFWSVQMDNKTSSIIDKVQKLLALSQSSNANEAAAAAAAANKLIDQYRLSEADLSSSSLENDSLVEDNKFVYSTGRIVPWKSNLIITLASHYGCAIFNSISFSPSGRRESNYKLIGKQSDIQITHYMFNWLSMECQRLSEKEAYGKGRVFVSSYCQGFVAGIRHQLIKSREEAKQNATTSAIVKIDSREQEAKHLMNKLYNLKNYKASSASRIDPRAFDAGLDRGKSIHLGKGLDSSTSCKMLNQA
jgi:hypothetical protein